MTVLLQYNFTSSPKSWHLCQNKTYDSSVIPASDVCVGVPWWKLPHPHPPILLPLTDLIPAWFHILRWSCGECASHRRRQVHFLCLQRVPHLNVTFSTSWALEKKKRKELYRIAKYCVQNVTRQEETTKKVSIITKIFIYITNTCMSSFLFHVAPYSFKEHQKYWLVEAE